jgi:hypothetical protein
MMVDNCWKQAPRGGLLAEPEDSCRIVSVSGRNRLSVAPPRLLERRSDLANNIKGEPGRMP